MLRILSGAVGIEGLLLNWVIIPFKLLLVFLRVKMYSRKNKYNYLAIGYKRWDIYEFRR